MQEIEVLDGDEDRLLAIAAAAEASSEHPLAQAIVAAAFERGAIPPDVESFEAVPGKGVVANVDGQEILVGRAEKSRHSLFARNSRQSGLISPAEIRGENTEKLLAPTSV